ncbi:MAG: ComF family protein [Chlorobium sp.]|jgi:ComF family protein|nr:ComF family protein [Chlorobium sp.]
MREQLLHLLFPHVCLLCKRLLLPGEEYCCTACMERFDPFSTISEAENELRSTIVAHFGERFPFERGWCRYLFHKKSALQQVLHSMKYEGLLHLGTMFGRQLGRWMLSGGGIGAIECLVPIPLHRLKKIERSYNQSEKIADGLAQSLRRPVRSEFLVRERFTVSQTGLSAIDREKNSAGAFLATSGVRGRHVLLVDDVVTTGATMAAAAEALRAGGAKSVSLAALALAARE